MIVKTEKGEYVNLATAVMIRTAKHPSTSAKHNCCYVLEACFPFPDGFLTIEMAYNYDAEDASILKDNVASAWARGDRTYDVIEAKDID